jgi:hypothetical protein
MTKSELKRFKIWYDNLTDRERNRGIDGWITVYPEYTNERFNEYVNKSKFVRFNRLIIFDHYHHYSIRVFNPEPYTERWIDIHWNQIKSFKVYHYNY